jgi:excisionase family DNA binding protein
LADRQVPTRDIAKQLACSQKTVRRLVKAGKIPVIRLGRELRFDPEAVVVALSQSARSERQ